MISISVNMQILLGVVSGVISLYYLWRQGIIKEINEAFEKWLIKKEREFR